MVYRQKLGLTKEAMKERDKIDQTKRIVNILRWEGGRVRGKLGNEL